LFEHPVNGRIEKKEKSGSRRVTRGKKEAPGLKWCLKKEEKPKPKGNWCEVPLFEKESIVRWQAVNATRREHASL